MDAIPAEVVERTWKRIGGISVRRSPRLARRMEKEQPVAVAYLLAVDHDILNQDERHLLFYLGMVVWRAMSQGAKPLPRVTEAALDEAEEGNLKLVEYLRSESEAGFVEAARTMLLSYGQPEVLKYVVEALMEEPEEGTLIRDENRGLMMLNVKTLIDCFDA